MTTCKHCGTDITKSHIDIRCIGVYQFDCKKNETLLVPYCETCNIANMDGEVIICLNETVES